MCVESEGFEDVVTDARELIFFRILHRNSVFWAKLNKNEISRLTKRSQYNPKSDDYVLQTHLVDFSYESDIVSSDDVKAEDDVFHSFRRAEDSLVTVVEDQVYRLIET